MGAADAGVAGERQLALGGEDAQSVIRLGPGRRQHKGGFRQVGPGGEALHVATCQPVGPEHDRDRIAAQRPVGEHIDLFELVALHPVRRLSFSIPRAASAQQLRRQLFQLGDDLGLLKGVEPDNGVLGPGLFETLEVVALTQLAGLTKGQDAD